MVLAKHTSQVTTAEEDSSGSIVTLYTRFWETRTYQHFERQPLEYKVFIHRYLLTFAEMRGNNIDLDSLGPNQTRPSLLISIDSAQPRA